jgi:hypothetical protein
MKRHIKQRWLEALRSGKYRQGRQALRTRSATVVFEGSVDQFCCLGVLCDLAVKDGVEMNVSVPYRGLAYYGHTSNFLPTEVLEWAGLDNSNPVFETLAPLPVKIQKEVGHNKNLAAANDAGATFNQIADIIEADIPADK